MLGRRFESLDSPRWRLRLPRRATLARGGAVIALLCLAAAILTAKPPPAPRPQPVRASAAPPAGLVGYPLRLPDPGVLAVLRQGQRLDVLAASGDSARVLVSDVLVLRASGGQPEGTLLYLAVSNDQAKRLAAAAPEVRLSVTVRSP